MENNENKKVEGGVGAILYLIAIGFVAYLLISAFF